MKKRIEHFLKTYFYFNKQEKRGAGLLGLLLVISLLCLYTYKSWLLAQTPQWRELKFDELLVADKDTGYASRTGKTLYSALQPSKNTQGIKTDSSHQKRISVRKPVYINLADSEALVALPGIGPVMAGRIIQYRGRLGGFYSFEQLTEVYGFKEDLLYDLQDLWILDKEHIAILNLNEVQLETLQKHPYFKFTLSRAIVNYRRQHGNFQQLEDLKQIPLVNDSVLTRIKPYCSLR